MPLSGASETLVRRWLDRSENRAEWERLRGALSLTEDFQFFALQVGDPITEHFMEMLLKAEAGDNGVGLAGFELSRPPEEGPIVRVLLRSLEAAPRPSWFFLRGCSMFREGRPALAELFFYLNQKRDVVSQTAGFPFLLSLSPEGWSLFRQTAPDFWSIHTSVYRFSGAEVRREERLREASEEAFVWQTLAEFVSLRLLRATLPPRSRRQQIWPPPAPTGLIGRASEKRILRTWLGQPGARILVQGFGGTGKTSLLREVMKEMPKEFPDGIFFFSLREAEDVPRILEEVVETLRPGPLPALLRQGVLQAMFRDATAERKVLLVLDDAEDIEALKRLVPSPPSAVLATGRAGPAPDGWRALSLDVLGPRESIELLHRISPGIAQATALSLVGEAGGHPLQLQILGGLAGSALQQRIDRWIMTPRERRLSLVQEITKAAVLGMTPDRKKAWGGAAVFQTSFETERFLAVASLPSVDLARERLEDLESRRLLDRQGESSWFMHPLLRRSALQVLGEEAAGLWRRKHALFHLRLLAGRSEEWKAFLPDVEEALRWLDASDGRSVPREFFLDRDGVTQAQDYLRHLSGRWASVWLDALARSAAEAGNVDLAAEAHRWSALADLREGEVDAARERFAFARALARESGTPELEAVILRDQAAFAFWAGRADEVSDLVQETLRLRPKSWTRGDLITLAMLTTVSLKEGSVEQLNELASLAEGAGSSVSPALRLLVGYTIRGRLVESKNFESLQEDLNTVFDPAADPAGDPGVRAWALALKAELQHRQEDPVAARESAESAVRQAHDAYDWEAESEALRVLGAIQEALGDLPRAESTYRRLLELREQLYPEYHEGVAWAARDLVRVLEAMARYVEAESYAHRVADIFRRGRPATDRALATTLAEWSRILVRLERTSEAETVLREALAASLSALGHAHLRSVHILGLLAYLTLTAGRLDEAEDLLRSAITIQERSEAPETLAGRHILGQNLSLLTRVLAERGQTRDALAILQDRQLPIFEELGDPQYLAFTLGQIAEILASEQRYDEALPLFERRIQLFEQLGDVRGRATALGEIGGLFAAQKRYAEALPLLREQLSILERLGDQQAVEEVQKHIQIYEVPTGE